MRKLFFLLCIFLFNCSNNEPSKIIDERSYLPINDGNEWIYKYKDIKTQKYDSLAEGTTQIDSGIATIKMTSLTILTSSYQVVLSKNN